MNCKIIARIARQNKTSIFENLFAVKDGYGYVENKKFGYRFKVTDLIKEDGTYDTLLLPHTAIKRTSSYSAYFNYAKFNFDDLVPEVEVTITTEKLKYLAGFAADSRQWRDLNNIFFMDVYGQKRVVATDAHTMCWDTFEVASGNIDDVYAVPVELVKLATSIFSGNVKISMNKENIWIDDGAETLVGERVWCLHSEDSFMEQSDQMQYLRTACGFNPPKDLSLDLTNNKLLSLEKNFSGNDKKAYVDTPTGLSDAVKVEKYFSILSNPRGILSRGYGIELLEGRSVIDAKELKMFKTKKNIKIYYCQEPQKSTQVSISSSKLKNNLHKSISLK